MKATLTLTPFCTYLSATVQSFVLAGKSPADRCKDFFGRETPPMAQPKNTAKSTKQQPAGKGKPAPKKGK